MRRARSVLFGLAGALVAIALAGRVEATVGPFECTVVARPSLQGSTLVRLAPLGSIELDTHTGPVAVELRVDELRPEDAERIAGDPTSLEGIEDELAGDARAALTSLAWRSLLAGVVGGLLGGLAARPTWRSAAAGTVMGGVLAAAVGGVAYVTFRPEAIAEPRYSGLLTVAPRAVGDVGAIVEQFDDYSAQLAGLVANVTALYRAAEGLPNLDPGDDAVRLLHVSDIHNNPQAYDLAEQIVDQFEVDAIVDTGDTTDWGTDLESRLFTRVSDLGVPYVWVRGNHDSRRTQFAMAAQRGAVVLDGEYADVAGLRIWGIGDPRFTPNKDGEVGVDVELEAIEAFTDDVERRLLADGAAEVDLVAVHDSRAAALIGDDVPLVLAGHTHSPRAGRIGEALLLREGSTGGAGLRSLIGEEPKPLTCSVLYFDPATDRLIAYDRITVSGLGGAGVRIERHVVDPPEASEPGDD